MKQKKFLIFNYKNNACLLKKKKKQTSNDAEMHEVISKPLVQPYLLDNCSLVLGVYSLGGLPVHFKYTSVRSDISTKLLQGTPGPAACFFHVIWP